jgi:hypothetical protein
VKEGGGRDRGRGKEILPRIRIWKIASTRMFKSEVETPRFQKENPTTSPTNNDCKMRPTLIIYLVRGRGKGRGGRGRSGCRGGRGRKEKISYL